MTTRRPRRLALSIRTAALAAALGWACSAHPDVSAVLSEPSRATEVGPPSAGERQPSPNAAPAAPAVEDPSQEGASQLDADRRASALRALAAEQPTDGAALVAASRALFQTADLRMQRAIVARLETNTPANFDELLEAGDHLDTTVRGEILALCEEGAALAKSAVELDPDDAGARTYYAINLSLVAWGKGSGKALLQGLGPRLSKAIKAAMSTGEDFEAMAPLRLDARFLTQAPWPYRDRDEALALLKRATEAHPIPVHHLFYGDVLALRGELDEAKREWTLARTAEPDDSTRLTAPCHRELARLRLALFE